MTMEVPPFQRPKPTLPHYPGRAQHRPGQPKCKNEGTGEMGGDESGAAPSSKKGELCCFSVMLNVGEGNGVPPPVLKHGPRSQTDAQGRRYRCQYFSRTEREVRTHPWCAQKFYQKYYAQHRPAPRGLSSSVPVWTRKVVNYA